MNENIKKLMQHENKSVRLYIQTICYLRNSQVFYSKIYDALCETDEHIIDELIKILCKEDFKDTADVIMWTEG